MACDPGVNKTALAWLGVIKARAHLCEEGWGGCGLGTKAGRSSDLRRETAVV